MKRMRVLVIGAGAHGSFIAAHLTRGGHEVVLVEDAEQRREDILLRGVRLAGSRGDHTVTIPVISPTDAPHLRVDVVSLCVTPARLNSALEVLQNVPRGYQTVVSFLGGLATFRLADQMAAAPPIAAVANFESRVRHDGVVEIGFDNFLWLGELDGQFTERLADLQAAMSWVAPTFVTRVIRDMLWSKAAYSLEVALSTLVDVRPDEVFAVPVARHVAAALVSENLALARAIGAVPAAFDFFDPNLYGAKNEGQAKTTDTWIRHGWVRHERFRDGATYDFPSKTGLSWTYSPANPSQETETLVQELMDVAAEPHVVLPLTKAFASLFDAVRAGARPLGWRNLEDLDNAVAALGKVAPVHQAG